MIEINNEIIGAFLFGCAFTLVITMNWINKYIHLTQWLENNAEMTWEIYRKLNK